MTTATAPMAFMHASVRDSYTGFMWCRAARHLLTPEAVNAAGKCKVCAAGCSGRYRQRRKAKR